jgi:hypothetical protein
MQSGRKSRRRAIHAMQLHQQALLSRPVNDVGVVFIVEPEQARLPRLR